MSAKSSGPVVNSKVVLLGDQGVGKSTLIETYVHHNRVNGTLSPTIGASYFDFKININSVAVNCQVWDTGGQERFRAIMPLYYRNSNAAILVYDVTSSPSLDNIKRWVFDLKRDVLHPMALIVVGNKIDLVDQRQITRNDGVQYANSIGATYFECSALKNQGIEQVFNGLALSVIKLQSNGMLKHIVCSEKACPLFASCTDLPSTDTAVEECVQLTIPSLAHGTTARKCCY